MLTAVAASALNKMIAKHAFDKNTISLTTPDIIKSMSKVVTDIYKL